MLPNIILYLVSKQSDIVNLPQKCSPSICMMGVSGDWCINKSSLLAGLLVSLLISCRPGLYYWQSQKYCYGNQASLQKVYNDCVDSRRVFTLKGEHLSMQLHAKKSIGIISALQFIKCFTTFHCLLNGHSTSLIASLFVMSVISKKL